MVSTSNLWINGAARPSSTGKTFDVVNPASQIVVVRAFAASSEDALAAITAANDALPAWEAVPARAKRDIFLKAAELLLSQKYSTRGVETIQLETSASEMWARRDTFGGSVYLKNAAADVFKLLGESFPSEAFPGGTVIVDRRPFGAIFSISPSNAPITLSARAVAIPLACGNTIVLKSSEMSPGSAELLVEVLHEAGLPKGVLNLLHVSREDSPDIVAQIIGHKHIRHVNFTGSDRVGRIIATEAAKYLKPCVFELGGKSAAIVLNDANVEEAARSIIYGSMVHSGQVCMSTERVIVQREVSSSLIDALATLAKKIRAGTSSSDHIGPLGSTTSASNVIHLIDDAKSRGAKVVVGDGVNEGAVVQPHILLGVEPGWPVWDRESFGPMFGIKIVDTPEEAVELANNTDYTLMGAVWTTNMQLGLKVARGIRAGHVLVNAPTIGSEPSLGIHGLGGATGYGRFDIQHFTQRRGIGIAPTGLKLPLVSDL